MGILKFNNKINYIHNKDFKTIIIRVMFPYTEKKEARTGTTADMRRNRKRNGKVSVQAP